MSDYDNSPKGRARIAEIRAQIKSGLDQLTKLYDAGLVPTPARSQLQARFQAALHLAEDYEREATEHAQRVLW